MSGNARMPRFRPCETCGADARREDSGGIAGQVDYRCTAHPHEHLDTIEDRTN